MDNVFDKLSFRAIRQHNIPDGLKAIDQWVCWRLETRDGKPTKVPYSPSTGGHARTDDPTTWGTFEAAMKAAEAEGVAGVGFVFSPHDPYCGIDLDHCIDADGTINEAAQGWIDALDSYSEYSQSGTGVHIICRATLPAGGRKSAAAGVEMYDRGRFFVMTGRNLDGTPTTIESRQDEADAMHAAVFGAPKKAPTMPAGAQNGAQGSIEAADVDDAALLERMFASSHGQAIAALWNGNTAAQGGDESAADLALCNYLAFWTGKDPGRMDRIFRQSGLYRPKWDRNARQGERYGEGTIRRAIEGTPEVWTPTTPRAYVNGNGNGEAFHTTTAPDAPPIDGTTADKPKRARKAKSSTQAGTTTPDAPPMKRELPPSEIVGGDLAAWGYSLRINEMDDSLYDGTKRFTDLDRYQMRLEARDAGYAQRKLLGALEDAHIALAAMNRFHPIRDYLAGLTWDGADHIAHLSAFFDDANESVFYADGTQRTAFHAFIRRWLINAVAKVWGDDSAARDAFVLVLAGTQRLGKSHFARWLCPIPELFVERHIDPDNKDCSLLRIRSFVWEVQELGASTRRADVEALKAFITTTVVTDRPPYARLDVHKPVCASFIGTVNPDGGGFLLDATGNRRFGVVDLDHVRWEYSERIDINQVWAQAVALWRADPLSYRLSPEERSTQERNAEGHEAADVLADMIDRFFEIDAQMHDVWAMSSSQVLERLRTYAGLSRGNDKVQGREIAQALRRYWKVQGKRSNGKTMYRGIRPRPTTSPDSLPTQETGTVH